MSQGGGIDQRELTTWPWPDDWRMMVSMARMHQIAAANMKKPFS